MLQGFYIPLGPSGKQQDTFMSLLECSSRLSQICYSKVPEKMVCTLSNPQKRIKHELLLAMRIGTARKSKCHIMWNFYESPQNPHKNTCQEVYF